MFQRLGIFTEFERSMIKERVRAGLAGAKAMERKLGRHRCRRPKRTPYGLPEKDHPSIVEPIELSTDAAQEVETAFAALVRQRVGKRYAQCELFAF
jgi:DNA invertase Pin-like site-specific DNA recombinase